MIGTENIEITFENHTLKAKILGDIDHHSAKRVRENIDNFMFLKKPSLVVLDLSSVDFMDSSGLGLILGRYTNAKDMGADFILFKPSRNVKKILNLAGIDRIMKIEGDSGNETF